MDLEQRQAKKIITRLLIVSALFILTLVTLMFSSDDIPPASMGGIDGKLGGDFTLTGVQGPVSLHDFKGKVVIVYFGFINCSEVCPTSMRVIQKTLESMQPQEVEKIQAILVSINGDEDSYEALDAYSKRFHHTIIGLTGSTEQIDHVIDEYGAYYSPTDLGGSDPGRAFRHSSRYFIVDQNGELVDAMRHSSTPNEIIARLRTLI